MRQYPVALTVITRIEHTRGRKNENGDVEGSASLRTEYLNKNQKLFQGLVIKHTIDVHQGHCKVAPQIGWLPVNHHMLPPGFRRH
jgi:hypothetical protein